MEHGDVEQAAVSQQQTVLELAPASVEANEAPPVVHHAQVASVSDENWLHDHDLEETLVGQKAKVISISLLAIHKS